MRLWCFRIHSLTHLWESREPIAAFSSSIFYSFLGNKNFFLHSSISYILSSSFRLFSVNKRPLEKMWLKLWYLIHFFLSQFSHNLFNFFSLKLFFVGSLFSIRGVFIVKIRDNNNNNNIEWMQERLMAESDHQRSLIDSYIISLLGSGH